MSYNLYRISGYITLYFSKVNRNMKNLKKTILLLFICGVFGDEVKKVSVMEGESVTLNSNLTDIHTYSYILWRFDSERIAEISDGKISYRDVLDGSFTDRLQLNSETASLTITNMRMKHSGLYEREAASTTSGTTYKKFSVFVYESPAAITVEAEIKSVSVKEGDPLTLQTDVLQPRDELIEWRFGDEGKLIAKADLEAKNSVHEDIDERFRDRLKLNNQDGSLTISNTRTTDSGLYLVKISSSKQTLYKRFIVTVTSLSPGEVAGIVVGGVMLAVVAAVAGFLYYHWKMGDVMKMTMNVGDFVTLNTGVTELHTDVEIQWWYGECRVAQITGGKERTYDVADDERFSGKLWLDKDTGNLSITDINIIHSGLYKLKITRKGLIRYKRFNLIVNLNTEQANVGDSHTLSVPSGTDLEEDDLILWKFGPQGSPIAKFDPINKITTYNDVSDERFKGKLNLDKKTGSLTITNITTEHTGLYKLQLSNSKRTINRKCRVTVTDPSKKPDQLYSSMELILKKGKPACLKTGVENLQNENIIWKFGDENSTIAEITEGTDPIIHDNVLRGRFKGRLDLDEKTGDLTIKETNTGDSGKYTVWVKKPQDKSTFLIFIVSVSDSTENGTSESATVEMRLLSEE